MEGSLKDLVKVLEALGTETQLIGLVVIVAAVLVYKLGFATNMAAIVLGGLVGLSLIVLGLMVPLIEKLDASAQALVAVVLVCVPLFLVFLLALVLVWPRAQGRP